VGREDKNHFQCNGDSVNCDRTRFENMILSLAESTDARLTAISRLVSVQAKQNQAIVDLQTAIMKDMRQLIECQIETDFIDPLTEFLTANADYQECVSIITDLSNDLAENIMTEVYAEEASCDGSNTEKI